MMNQPLPTASRSRRAALSILCAFCALAGLSAGAQPAPDPMFQGFEPIGDYSLVVDGETVPGAEIYQSDRARAILVMSSALDQPLLFNLRSRQVQRVGFMSLAKNPSGTIDVLAEADITPVTSFTVDQEGASATVAGTRVALRTRESLTGHHDADALAAHDPSYDRKADAYSPNESLLEDLRAQGKDIRVQVFFNSKCGVCKQMVPRIIKVDRVLEDTVIEFDYYGVPDSYQDPLIEEKGVDGVPTGIVYVDGVEAGRIVGGEWKIPELAIKNTILQAS